MKDFYMHSFRRFMFAWFVGFVVFRTQAEENIDNSKTHRITVQLIKKSTTPDLKSIAPYREALVYCHYRVVKPGIGRQSIRDAKKLGFPHKADIIIAKWGLYGTKDQRLADLQEGSQFAISIQPIANFKSLEFVQKSNDLGDESLTWPVFLDVDQHRLMKDPETGEAYGLQTYKMRDLLNLRHQIKLFAVGDSRAHKGIKPNEFYPDENKKRIVSYNASYDSTGFKHAMTLMEYAPSMPELEWIVHSISARAVRPGYNGREMVWNFVTSSGVRQDRANGFADWKPTPGLVTNLSPDSYEWQAKGTYGGVGAGSRGSGKAIRPWGWESTTRQKITQREVFVSKNKKDVRRPFDAKRMIDQNRMDQYEAHLRTLNTQGVKVLGFIPPMCTDPQKSDYDSEDRATRNVYAGVVATLEGIAERNPNFFFYDLHRFGDNGFAVDHFSDDDHLNAKGAAKLTKMLEDLRKKHSGE